MDIGQAGMDLEAIAARVGKLEATAAPHPPAPRAEQLPGLGRHCTVPRTPDALRHGRQRGLPSAPAEFTSVYTRRSRNRWESGRGMVPPLTAREALGNTQTLASVQWKQQLSDRTHGSQRPFEGMHPGQWRTKLWREQFAMKEGRVIQDDQYWDNVKAAKKQTSAKTKKIAGDDGEMASWHKQLQRWEGTRHRKQKTFKQKQVPPPSKD